MDTQVSFAASGTLHAQLRWRALIARSILVSLAVLFLLALGILALPGQARAAGSGPRIIFSAPIYAGLNNGDPEGPVGTSVVIAGSGWANVGDAVMLTLADQQNDTAGDSGSACTNGSQAVTIQGQTGLPDASGNFTAAFPWPMQAGMTGHAYWMCGSQNGTAAKGVQAFRVLAALPPSLGVSAAEVPKNGMVTITGQNWLPGSSQDFNQKISVIVAPCVACDPGGPNFISSATVSAGPDGTFTVALPVPPGAKVGDKLYASAQSLGDGSNSLPAGTLSTSVSTAANFTVTNQPTATPAPTNTPTNTPTAPPAPTKAAGAENGGNTNAAPGNALLLVLLLALGGVLLLAAAVALILFLRSRSTAPAPTRGGGPGYRGRGPGYSGGDTYYGQEADFPGQGSGYSRSGPPRRSTRPGSDAPYTNADYYGPRQGGRSTPPGAYPGQRGSRASQQNWRGGAPPEPESDDDGFGDAPTVGTNTPWRQ